MLLKKQADFKVDSRLSHIAFIMDGNGRWAKKRGLPRKVGHKFGAEAFEKTVRNCHKFGIKIVTVYAFSTENWSRPKEEVDAIISLLEQYVEKAKEYDDIRVVFLGDKAPLPEGLQKKIIDLEIETSHFENTLNIAFNYGGRAEIVNACNELLKAGVQRVTEDDIASHLYTRGLPDPDLIVRTGNEVRLSNFLLWQSAYSEIYISKALWPDFDKKELIKAIKNFYGRKRRFGGIINK